VACGEAVGGEADIEVIVAEGTRERERERERIILMVEKLGRILVFLQLWTQFPPLSGHEIHPYLYGVEEEYVVFYGVKSWPLIQPRRILTSGSKWSL
jgi:hypothetical protein